MGLLAERLNLAIDFHDHTDDYDYYINSTVPRELVKNGTHDIDAWFYEKEKIYEHDFDFTLPIYYVSPSYIKT